MNTTHLTVHSKEGVKEYPVEKADFHMNIKTEKWDEATQTWVYGKDHLSVRYGLEVYPKGVTGEDGDPTPCANNIPIFHTSGHRYPILGDLRGKTIDTPDSQWEWDAWYGNDAPTLDHNRMTFVKVERNILHIIWDARYGDVNETIHFEGSAVCEGIWLQVKKEGDEDAFMTELFGESLKDWEKKTENWVDYGEDWPVDRRRWLNIQYAPI